MLFICYLDLLFPFPHYYFVIILAFHIPHCFPRKALQIESRYTFQRLPPTFLSMTVAYTLFMELPFQMPDLDIDLQFSGYKIGICFVSKTSITFFVMYISSVPASLASHMQQCDFSLTLNNYIMTIQLILQFLCMKRPTPEKNEMLRPAIQKTKRQLKHSKGGFYKLSRKT